MGLKNGKHLIKSDKEKAITDSKKAYAFNIKTLGGTKKVGGNKIKHKPSSYGMAIKWLIYIKKMTYKQFAYLYNGTTAQNANHLINRISKERFFEDDLEKMCEVLGVSYSYLCELANGIDKLMESGVDASIS